MDGNHSHHESSDACSGMGMRMTFHGGYCETLLFEYWKIRTVWGMVGSCLAVFIIAILFEGIKQYREHCWSTDETPENRTVRNLMFRRGHYFQTFLHLVQYALAYCLMLLLMSFNYWLMGCIILGGAAGFLLWKVRWPSDEHKLKKNLHYASSSNPNFEG